MRELFLLDPEVVFLNHGSFGACPRDVFDTFQRWQRELERNPVDFLGRRSGVLLGQARHVLAQYLGTSASDLAWVTNATTAVNIVARSLALAPGDEVLGTDHEYGACEAAWQHVCKQAGATYRRVEIPLPFDAEAFTGRMMAAAGHRTKALFASHITSTTALRLPVESLCKAARDAGIATVIDGAHAPGQLSLQLDALGADFYTGNCHKWLCAPKGSAFLHVQPARQAALHASVVSWGYVAGDGGHSGFDAYTGSSMLERRLQWQGTRDLAAFLSVPAAIDFQARHDWRAQRQRCNALALQAMHQVLDRNGLQPIAADACFAQMVPIPVRTTKAEVLRQTLLARHAIEVPVTQHQEHTFVRLSVQAYNTAADVNRLLTALDALSI